MDEVIDRKMNWGNASESHWLNEMEKSIGKQREKRKLNEDDNKKKKGRGINWFPELGLPHAYQEVRDKKQLAVRCGPMAGCLYRIKYDIGEKCILCKGKWYSPRQFEIIGGKMHYKKWKFSIFYKPSNGFQQVQLMKLIQSGVLPEFGHLRQSVSQVTPTDKHSANSGKNMTRRRELMNGLKGFPESWKRLFDKTISIPVRGIEKNTLEKETIQPESSSDESESVAQRVKMNRRESVMLAETVSKNTTEPIGSTASDRGSPAHPVDASEPKVSPVIEDAIQTTDDPTRAGQLSLSASPAEWQNHVPSEKTVETRQLQLYELLTKQFNTINNTLQSIDLSLKKLVEKQSHDTLPPQYVTITPAVIEHPQIHSLVKQEQVTDVVTTCLGL